MAKQRLTRKEIRQPDQLVSFSVQMAEWATSHVKLILYSGAGILVVIGLVLGWSLWRSRQYRQAESMFYEAVKLLKAPENTSDASTSQTAIALLQDITRHYARTPTAGLAYWHLGHTYFSQKEYANALSAYQQARDHLRRDNKSVLPALITMNIASVQEMTRACAEAIPNFEAVIQSSARWLHEAAYFDMGRCYESQGAPDKALATYDRALAEEISESGRQTLEERIRLLSPLKKGE